MLRCVVFRFFTAEAVLKVESVGGCFVLRHKVDSLMGISQRRDSPARIPPQHGRIERRGIKPFTPTGVTVTRLRACTSPDEDCICVLQ